MPNNIRISSKLGLHEIERLLQDDYQQSDTVDLQLPTDFGAQFFKFTRVGYLIASLSHRCKLRIIETQPFTDAQRQTRYGTTVEGLAVLGYARAFVDLRGAPVSPDRRSLMWRVQEREGRVEEAGLGASLSYCCFDYRDKDKSSTSLPIALSKINADRKGFVSDFKKVRKQFFEQGIAAGYSSRASQQNLFSVQANADPTSSDMDPDEALTSFVFEVFQNGFRHGCRDAVGLPIPGLRYLALRKHIAQSKADFLERAEGFRELANYLEENTLSSGTSSFLEISISDHGLGIVDRFVATRPEFRLADDKIESQAELLISIIEKSLTSNTTQSGAGRGLERALDAVRDLRGFVSLRTGRLWMYAAAPVAYSNRPLSLARVGATDHLSYIAGTHFNLLLPLVS